MIGYFNGGNTMQPPEPVLSRAESAAMFPKTVFCPIPKLTDAQRHRSALYRVAMHAWMADRRQLCRAPFPVFDDEPSQRCSGDDMDTARRCGRARTRLMERLDAY